ncbi:MAG: hypothetical protein FWG20_01620, partial [Candidatus Cloacimonetes bacterium]|nr:hypothetical protein [Candidatus Cloacimonadota bacterium]
MRRFILLFICMIFSGLLLAQAEWLSYRVETTQYPDNPYRAIAFDTMGNTWIGTQDKGIYRFDGSDWAVYNTTNTDLPTNRINHLAIDSNNNLWIGTSGYGLIRKVAGNSWTTANMIFHNLQNSESDFPSNEVSWITMQRNASGSFTDRILVATTNGLAVFNDPIDNPYGISVIKMNEENPILLTNEFTSVDIQYNAINGNAMVRWFGTAQGLYKTSALGENWVLYNTSNSVLTGNGINNVRVDHLGNTWVSVYNWSNSTGGGLIRIPATESQTWDVYNATNPNTLPSNYIRDIKFERDGNNSITWLATDEGIVRFDGSNWTTYTLPQIPTKNIYSVTVRANGEKWFGTNFNLLKLAGTVWTANNIFGSGIPSNNVQTVAFEAENIVKWIGTANGMTRFDGNDWIVYNMANSQLPTNDVRSLAVDHSNLLWVGTAKFVNLGGGLARFNFQTKEWVIYKKTDTSNPLDSDTISKIAIDTNNTKWIGTLEQGGLYSLNTAGQWTSYKYSPTGLASNNISDIFIDEENNKWIATPDYGISVLDAENSFIHRYNTVNSNLLSNDIKKIKQDKKGFIWAVTAYGIGKLVDDVWQIYTSENTNSILPNTGLTDIDFDINNIGWITSNEGLIRTNEIDWTTITDLSPNHLLPSNNLNAIFMENTETNSIKWICTKDSGVSLFRGGNSAFGTGSHIFIFQHPITPNALKITGMVNNFVVDDVEFRVNNVVTPHTEVATNTWFADYTVPSTQNVTIRFRFWHAAGDSIQDRRINVTLLNGDKPGNLDGLASLGLLTSLPTEEWFVTELHEGFYRFTDIRESLKGNLILKTAAGNAIQQKVNLDDERFYWVDLPTYPI